MLSVDEQTRPHLTFRRDRIKYVAKLQRVYAQRTRWRVVPPASSQLYAMGFMNFNCVQMLVPQV